MKNNLGRAVTGLSIFVVVCLAGTFALFAIFTQFRLQSENLYHAEFSDVGGLAVGDFVRIAGVEVGKVKSVSINPQSIATVEFSADPSVELTTTTKAAIRWADPLGHRYIGLLDGGVDGQRMPPGAVIPVDRTEPALDLDTLLGGFRPLFRALNPDQVNALSTELIQVLQGEGPTINSFLNQAAAVTNTLADHDELIGQVINNLHTVMGTLAGNGDQVAKAVDSLSTLTRALADRKADITNSVAYVDASTATIADLLARARPPFAQAVTQTDRAAGLVLADHEYVEHLIDTLPESYKAISRLGLYGDYFSFYLCDLIFKVNGKGGQPVYVRIADQTTGRCAPK
jgi:phospholipid/cholesterol/gamma-HCH transport system substrate-binding protein